MSCRITPEVAASAADRALARMGVVVPPKPSVATWAEIVRPRTDKELAREYIRTAFVHPERHGLAPATVFPAAREAEHTCFAGAERELAEAVEAETGLSVDEAGWSERATERADLLRQSHQIAAKLEVGGTTAYRSDEYQLHLVSIFSEQRPRSPAASPRVGAPPVSACSRSPCPAMPGRRPIGRPPTPPASPSCLPGPSGACVLSSFPMLT